MNLYIIVSLASLIIGSGATYLVTKPKERIQEPVVVIPDNKVAEEQIEIQKQLTAPDLVSVACSKEYIDENKDLLCREMFCRMQQRGIDAKTSSTECEEISNIANSIVIINTCKEQEDFQSCNQLFRERK